MYDIKIKANFSAAHNLRNYHGKCENLHGHNWAIEAVFSYAIVGKDGMAIDFKKAKKLLNSVLEKFDHSYLNKTAVFKKLNPTSENMAKLIYDEVKKKDGHISSVSVWENENSSATYRED